MIWNFLALAVVVGVPVTALAATVALTLAALHLTGLAREARELMTLREQQAPPVHPSRRPVTRVET